MLHQGDEHADEAHRSANMSRTVKDIEDRTWTCTPQSGVDAGQGRDVVLSCVTDSVAAPVRLTVGWQWEKMADNGLARMIALASPVLRR
jgi:hypothetical protein